MLHFKISEFTKHGQRLWIKRKNSIIVADKILENFIIPLSDIRERLGTPIFITSGYRPRWYEIYKGRSGTSQHTFKGKGAADISCHDSRLQDLKIFLFLNSDFSRICFYPERNFFHVDYASKDNKRRYYEDTGYGWEFKDEI